MSLEENQRLTVSMADVRKCLEVIAIKLLVADGNRKQCPGSENYYKGQVVAYATAAELVEAMFSVAVKERDRLS